MPSKSAHHETTGKAAERIEALLTKYRRRKKLTVKEKRPLENCRIHAAGVRRGERSFGGRVLLRYFGTETRSGS